MNLFQTQEKKKMLLVKAQALIKEGILSCEALWKSRRTCRFLKKPRTCSLSDLG